MPSRIKTLLLAALAVILLSLSFPNPLFPYFFKPGPWIAFFSLVPVFELLRGRNAKSSFGLMFAVGMLFFLISLVWINNIRPMGPGAAPAWIALSACSALNFGLFGLIYAQGQAAAWKYPVLWVPSVWTLLEFAREHVLDGFPWGSLGSSQYMETGLLPIASSAGIYGLHFTVSAVSFLVWLAWQAKFFKKPWPWKEFLAMAAVVAALLFAGKTYRPQREGTARMALLQINVNPDTQWNQKYKDLVMGLYQRHMATALSRGAKVMVWPETNFPGIYNIQTKEAQRVRDFTQAFDVSLLLGSNEYDGNKRYYNSSFLVEPGSKEQVYRKRHLVAFGEYMPLRWLFENIPGVKKVVQRLGPGDFRAGKKSVVFKSRRGKFAPIICWETVFTNETQDAVKGGAEVIVLQTFDGWFGKSAAPFYLSAQAAFRAVESGRWVARAAVTGISVFVDPKGNFYDLMGLEDRGVSVRDVPLLSGKTLYTRFGNWFVWLCLLVALFCALAGGRLDNA